MITELASYIVHRSTYIYIYRSYIYTYAFALSSSRFDIVNFLNRKSFVYLNACSHSLIVLFPCSVVLIGKKVVTLGFGVVGTLDFYFQRQEI